MLQREYDPTLQAPTERQGLLSQGILRLRRLFVQVANITTLRTDTITERTSAAGVTVDSVLLKDGVVTVGDVAFDDATSDPLIDGDSAVDGTENSVARKDHVHPKHHAQAHGPSDHTGFANWKVIYTDGSGDQQELALGTDGQKLAATGASSAPAFEDDLETINYVIDGGGATITTGEKGHVVVDFAGTIQSVTLLADQSGSIVVDIWKDTYANFLPTNADSITASAVPTITTATKSQDSTLTGWTTSITAGDILAYNVDSVTTCQRVTVALKVKRT